MAYAKSSLVQDIRHLLQDNPWETTSTTTGTGTPVAVPDGTKWAVGDVGEWSFSGTAGGEQFLVQSISSNNLTIVRGYNGTTAEAHTSGDRVVKNPRYSVIQITDSIDRVIDAAYPSVWKAVSSTITPAPSTTTWYDSELTGADLTGLIDLIGGTQSYGTGQIGFFGYGIPTRPIRIQEGIPTATLASTVGIRFPGGVWHPTNDITVRFRTKLTNTVSGGNYSDLDEGLFTECVAYGVAARLLSAKEIPNVSEGARVDQSQVGAYTSVSGWFELKHRELLMTYRTELERRIPAAADQGWL